MISKILASVGLPDTPEGRKLFYHTFPSKELYEMAMGGVLPTAQTGKTTGSEGVYNASKKPFIAPKVANKVAAPGEGFVLMEGQDPEAIKTYYDKKLKEAEPGKPGLPSETPPADKKKYKEWVIGLAKQGYKPEEIIGKKYASSDMLGILNENYQAQYTEKEKPIIKEKPIDLGIGWAGERKALFGQSLGKIKDSAGKEYNMQQFNIPAVWDPKTKGWDTSGSWNQGTTITGYYDQDAKKFNHFNPSSSDVDPTGNFYPKETLKAPDYIQQMGVGEGENIMKHGPLIINGATAVDVQNSGMGYNPEKDVVEPLNTRGGGRGIGKSKLVKDVGVENLPAGTGYLNTGQPLIQDKEGGLTYPLLPNFINPEYIMACGGMHKMQPGGNHSMGFIGGFEGTKNKPVLTNAQVEEIARTNEPGYANKYDQMRIDAFKEYAKTHPKAGFKEGFGDMINQITSAPGKAWDWLNVDMPAYILSAGARAGEKAGLEANSELFPDYTKTMNDTTMKGLTPAQQQLKKIGQSKKEGGPTYPGQTQQSKGNEITDQFLNYIKNNTMKAIANEESNNMQQEMMNSFMQNGGNNVYGYNPNMNNQNAFINAANNTRQKTQQDVGNFFSATQNLNDTANPYMETEITQADDGIQVMTNPATGRPYSPEEYAALQAHFGNKTQTKNEPDKHGEKWYNQGAGTHGMNYMPMNYNPFVKFSDETKKNYEELVNNPTSNLKSFKSRHFGPFGKTVMEFGYKDKMQPFIPTPAQPVNNVPVNSNPNQFTKPEEQETLRQAKGYDPIKAQFGYDFLGSSQTETNNAMSGKPAVDPMYTTVAQGKTDADIAREKAGLPPESLTSDPLTNYGGPEKTKKLTQKYRPGFDNEAGANWIMAGMNGVASMFENADARKNEEKWKSLQGADNQFYAMQAGNKGGTDQFGRIVGNGTPTQFKGQNFGQIGSPYTAAGKYGGSYEEGGEYYMTDDEIMAIVRSGGQIEFLD